MKKKKKHAAPTAKGLGSDVPSPLLHSGGWGWSQKPCEENCFRLYIAQTLGSFSFHPDSTFFFILFNLPPTQCSSGHPSTISSIFGPLPTAPGLQTKAQACWMICKFKAGRVTWALLFPWSPGPRGTLVMRRWLDCRTYSESTSLDSLGLCRIMSVSSSWNVSTVLWPGETLNDFSLSWSGYYSLWSRSIPALFTQLHAHSSPEQSPTLTPYLHPVSQILPVSCNFM